MTIDIESEQDVLIRHKTTYYQKYCALPKDKRNGKIGSDLLDKTIDAVYKLHEIQDKKPLASITRFPARVRLSSFFNHPYNPNAKYRDRNGYAVGESKDKARYFVIWDGTISKVGYHKEFIEPA